MSNHLTQIKVLLRHLQSGRKITGLEALKMYGIMSTPRRILDIEDLGHLINKDTITVIKEDGTKAHVTEYSYAKENFKNNLFDGVTT